MTKAQLATALRRSFGDTVIQSQGAISKLFDSFDFNRTDEMDWRAFLYMLTILMQPYLFCDALMRYSRDIALFSVVNKSHARMYLTVVASPFITFYNCSFHDD